MGLGVGVGMGEEFVEEAGGFFEEVFGAIAGGVPGLGWGLGRGPGDDADWGVGRGRFLVDEEASSGVWSDGEDIDGEWFVEWKIFEGLPSGEGGEVGTMGGGIFGLGNDDFFFGDVEFGEFEGG